MTIERTTDRALRANVLRDQSVPNTLGGVSPATNQRVGPATRLGAIAMASGVALALVAILMRSA